MDEAYEKFCYFYRLWLKRTKVEKLPEDVERWFKEFEGTGRMTQSRLCEFLKKYQGEDEESASQLAQKAISRSLHRSHGLIKKDGLSRNGFLKFLLSRDLNPALAKKGQDDDGMEDPLPHYFVYASHHSFLKREQATQNLFMSNSMASVTTAKEEYRNSLTAITKALEKGVRVIELHLHSDSHNKAVYVYHQRPSHSSLKLTSCLDAIHEHAFKNSKFPVVIVLVENLDKNLQAIVAEKIKTTFGNMVCPPGEAFTKSLKLLKEKFIVLRRQPKQEPNNENRDDIPGVYKELVAAHIMERGLTPNVMTCDSNRVKVFSSTDSVLENAKSGNISRITQKNLLVVYPNDNCPDEDNVSSNYDPFIGWSHGAQIVSLNMQVKDKYLWIMQGLFRAYGETGFVRKPRILLDKEFDPTAWRPVKKILKVKVYMGTGWHLDFDSKDFDTKSPPDFFTALEIVGVPDDEAREKTVPIMDQWIPTWDQEFEFPLTVPELAMLKIEVKEFDPDRTHDFGGQTCLPVGLLRNGIRSVPLYKENGAQYISARLLIHFQLY